MPVEQALLPWGGGKGSSWEKRSGEEPGNIPEERSPGTSPGSYSGPGSLPDRPHLCAIEERNDWLEKKHL